MKIIFIFLTVFTLKSNLYSDGRELGNGGDGIILKNDKIVLFDLYERNIDADEVVNKALQLNPKYVVYDKVFENFNSEIFDNVSSNSHGQYVLQNTQKALAAILSAYSERYPVLIKKIFEIINELVFIKASADLLPNPDTKSFLKLKDEEIVGCARTIRNQVILSPSCIGEKMSPANKAALILHEIIYYYLKELNPEINDSFDVRTIVATFFNLDQEGSKREISFIKSGLNNLIEENNKMEELFYNVSLLNWGFVQCEFSDWENTNLTMQFQGYLVRGDFDNEYMSICDRNIYSSQDRRYLGQDCIIESYRDFKKAKNKWLVSDIIYDLYNKKIIIDLLKDNVRQSLVFSFQKNLFSNKYETNKVEFFGATFNGATLLKYKKSGSCKMNGFRIISDKKGE